MWCLPSGNHIIWIRPKFQSVEERRVDIAMRYKEGKIDTAQAVIEQIKWGDEQSPADLKTWFSVAYDPANGFWVARANHEICEGFLNARTGSAVKSGENLHLYAKENNPALELLAYQFAGEGTPKLFGQAMSQAEKIKMAIEPGNIVAASCANWTWLRWCHRSGPPKWSKQRLRTRISRPRCAESSAPWPTPLFS